MFAGILHRYLMVIIACIALLVGLQAPSLVDQYQKRVDAHLREVTISLQSFQEIANRHFNGNMTQLIELHRISNEKPFQEEAAALEQMIQRKARFEAELAALAVALPHRIAHVLFRSDKEILDETFAQYTYTVPLNQDALVTGSVFALMVLLLMELLLTIVHRGVRACSQ
jgi:hypothetical protein